MFFSFFGGRGRKNRGQMLTVFVLVMTLQSCAENPDSFVAVVTR